PMTLPLILALHQGPQQPPTEDPGAGEGGGGLFSGNFLFVMVAILAIFYFVMIVPEKKQRKKREDMLGALKKGDKVMTTSGVYAAVAQVQDDIVTLQVADGVRMRFSRTSIQTVLVDEPKGDDDKGKKA
ncbi:MAG: preprotein translocase subunit YajC, partial [Planctomycetota bacterium]|nr:preprotein translocase subunit YajC [Planctomycetota bacterium]